jgi:hypothetical protein
MKICLQAGHINIIYNSILSLRGGTGAPNEQVHNLAITNKTCELLRERGFEVKQTDANANDDSSITGTDWDMFLAIHCDSDSASNGGFTDYPEPSTDGATAKSQDLANKIADKYFPESGITRRDDRRQKSPDVMYYYMWQYLSNKTPCVLIELGESVDVKDSVILNDVERCAKALTRGICNAFGVAYDITPTVPPVVEPSMPSQTASGTDCSTYITQIKNLLAEQKEINTIASKSHIFYKSDWNKIKELSK